MLKINFYPESEEYEHIPAAKEYQEIWDKEGERIFSTIEKVSKLDFNRKFLNVLVYEGISFARPMCLRASYSYEFKKAALIHELCHRLLRLYDRNHLKHSPLDQHKDIDLILYDIWLELYGKSFADNSVLEESSRDISVFYKEAWDWTLSINKEERVKEFKKLVKKSKNT